MLEQVEKIKAAFERDRRRGAGVRGPDELPQTYESITDAWLTRVLCGRVPGAEVVGHTLGPPDSGSSNRRKVGIQYNAAGKAAGLPEKLFCKATHELANRIVLGVSGGAAIEAEFYNRIRPILNIEAPVPYYAHVDEETCNSIIMLGDISGTVTEFCNHHTKMTKARAESQMRLIAVFHAKLLDPANCKAYLSNYPTWPQYFRRSMQFGLEAGSNAGFLDGESVIPARTFKRYPEVWGKTMVSVDRHDSLPQTLSHGDVHLKNWYVAGSGEMGLSDWQCASRGHWGRDLAYTISTALTVEDRRAWEKDLVRYYLDRLHAEGGPRVSFDEAFLHYRQQLLSVLTWWTITLHPAPDMPDMQPRDITLEFVRRITTAMDDLDTLDI